MGSKRNSNAVTLFFLVNLLFFTIANACHTCPPHKKHNPTFKPTPGSNPPFNPTPGTNPGPFNPTPGSNPGPFNPTPGTNPGPFNPTPGTNPGPFNPTPGSNPGPINPTPGSNPGPINPTPGSNPGSTVTCPRDALKLGVCAEVLGGLINVTIGNPPVTPCCSLISGLVDLEAAVCLCTAITANILGINLNIPVSLSLLLNVCSRNVPPGFQCP